MNVFVSAAARWVKKITQLQEILYPLIYTYNFIIDIPAAHMSHIIEMRSAYVFCTYHRGDCFEMIYTAASKMPKLSCHSHMTNLKLTVITPAE